MSVIVYPVAANADGALHAPQGFAARESEARLLAVGPVSFVAEPVGPTFASQESAQAAYGSAARGGAALTSGWGRLTPVTPTEGSRAAPAPRKPTYVDGRRWPAAATPTAPSGWRLWVSYWRVDAAAADADGAGTEATGVPDMAARRLRRGGDGPGLAPAVLNALARQPLRPVRPQQPLDIGLFETRRPEAPDLIIPDE